MAPASAKRPSREEPESAQPPAKGREPTLRGELQGERIGPLEIQRIEKDDGRALILYTHAERDPT